MQASHTGLGLDLSAVAAACGFVRTGVLSDQTGLDQLIGTLRARQHGPDLYVAKIEARNLPRSLPPRDAVHIKNRFRAHLGLATA